MIYWPPNQQQPQDEINEHISGDDNDSFDNIVIPAISLKEGHDMYIDFNSDGISEDSDEDIFDIY